MQKIDQCNIIFDFNDQTADMKSKEIKRLALHELLDYVANNRSVITDTAPVVCTGRTSTFSSTWPRKASLASGASNVNRNSC